MKVIIFNGGIECGKDTIGKLLADELRASHQDVLITGFKAALFEAVQEVFALSPAEWVHFMLLYDDRATKEQVWNRLGADGRYFSPRGAMIYVSEEVYKPIYGKKAFGVKLQAGLNNKLAAQHYDYAICPDGGFIEELAPVCEDFEVLFFSLRGRGTFEGDSRRELEEDECLAAGVAQYSVINLVDGRPIKAMLEVLQEIQRFNG